MALDVVARFGSPDMRKGMKAILRWKEAGGSYAESTLLLGAADAESIIEARKMPHFFCFFSFCICSLIDTV